MNNKILQLLDEIDNEEIKQKVENYFYNIFQRYLGKIKDINDEITSSNVSLNDEIYIKIKYENDNILKISEELISNIKSKKIKKEISKIFREIQVDPYESVIVNKGYIKEYGYSGDFEMMNFVYNQKIVSTSERGKYWDKYFLENAYADSVRRRKDKMAKNLHDLVSKENRKKINILNLPCGPARDVKDFLRQNEIREDLHIAITCIDQDKEALKYAKESINDIPKNINLVFKQGNILHYLRNPNKYKDELGMFDVVYSIGLADYLSDKLLKNMIKFSWNLLRKKGKIIFSFKIHDRDPYAPLAPKWWCDWSFVSRNIEDVKALLMSSGIESFDFGDIEWEESKRIAFFTLVKE